MLKNECEKRGTSLSYTKSGDQNLKPCRLKHYILMFRRNRKHDYNSYSDLQPKHFSSIDFLNAH